MSSDFTRDSAGGTKEKKGLMESLGFPKNYEPGAEEPKWQKWWEQNSVYRFDPKDSARQTYSIDTPPPYPSGDFHVGNALNHCYFDFVARYKRMKGFNVHFPQGWDCHGLPTEVNAEKTFKVKKNDVPPAQFVEMCRKLTQETIGRMKDAILRLGISIDWNLEYRTMDPAYYKLTQLSFLRLFKTGQIYRGEHPVNWCPRCETAIAEAEVEHQDRRGVLVYMRFGGEKGVDIASTRPELLASCVAVAVNPKDERYGAIGGSKVEVPIFGRTVPVIADEEVDPSFGTGAVMVCTFGDKMDVKWQNKYRLPIIRAVSENGRLTEAAGPFQGLKLEEARKKTIERLTGEKRVLKTEPLTQSIGVCWRCKTPVEIISKPQWFMKTLVLRDSVLQWVEKLRWVPSFSKQRLVDWTNSLDWDWVISRQRVFATPIPLWYCSKCGEVALPGEADLPVDPRTKQHPNLKCAKCGSTELRGEKDVLDTWMDSSISAPVHAGWPGNPDQFKRLFPADLQPNGLDIVRTWDYYLLVRSLALFRVAPYKTLLINGMVRGSDGRMMHKSYGNYVESGEALQKFGADAFRQWAAGGGSTGYDTPFRWTEVEHGKKFLNKLWNVARFILSNQPAQVPDNEPRDLTLLDRWLLSSLQDLVVRVSEALEEFQFNIALEAIRDFTWHSLADNYIEAVKYRLQPEADGASQQAAQWCLRESLSAICKLLAPICPHITESIYQELSKQEGKSVHLAAWPDPRSELVKPEWIKNGQVLVDTIADGRRKKAEKGLALKAPLKVLVVTTSKENLGFLNENQEPILRTLKAEALQLKESESGPSEKPPVVVVEIVA